MVCEEQVILPDYLFSVMDTEKAMDQSMEESKEEASWQRIGSVADKHHYHWIIQAVNEKQPGLIV